MRGFKNFKHNLLTIFVAFMTILVSTILFSTVAQADDENDNSLKTDVILTINPTDYSIDGKVTEDMFGTNVEGVTVAFTTPEVSFFERLFNNTSNEIYTTTTDVNGEYEIKLSTPTDGELSFNKTGYQEYTQKIKKEEMSGGQVVINPIMHKEYSNLSGKVVDKNNTPVPNASVIWVNNDGTTLTTTTDNNGNYSVDTKRGVGGKVTITYENDKGETIVADTELEKDFVAPTIQLQNTVIDRVNIYGTVLDKNGVPLSNADITWKTNNKKYTATTDENGNYSIPVPYGESGELVISWDTASSTQSISGDKLYTDYSNGTTKLDIDSKHITVTGTVVDKNGVPIPSVEVTYINDAGETVTVTTDENGNYNIIIPRNTPGNLIIKYDDAIITQELSKDDTKTDFDNGTSKLDIDITKVIVTGKVVDKDNKPVSNAIVTYTNDKGYSVTVATDADGNFSILVPRNETGTLTITYDGHSMTVNLTADNTKHNYDIGSVTLDISSEDVAKAASAAKVASIAKTADKASYIAICAGGLAIIAFSIIIVSRRKRNK